MPHSTQPPFVDPVDVVVVGGGPIGTLLGVQLAKFGCRPLVIEKDDKANAPVYGRATTLWPRTLEMYDQLDLLDPLLAMGVISQTGMNFRHGNLAPGGLVFAYGMDKHGETSCDFALHLRQRLTERAFEHELAKLHQPVLHLHQLEGWTESVDPADPYPVVCVVRNLVSGLTYRVKTRYLVGADGGKSFVRKTAGIPFEGERSASKWIRMDALVKTNMPNSRMLNSVQSDTHGLVLFCPIDEGKTRIGYVYNDSLKEKYGDQVTAEIAMEEAKKAVAPFSLEFVTLDWHTLYGIGQCMATTFVQDRVILVGDACHTHSSGSAQGLNTGSHDAINLGWKLALICKGLGMADILLDSYNQERKSSVQQVVDNDRIIATLISGHLPPKFAHRTESPRDLLTEWFDNSRVQAFTLGLGVGYESVTPSVINRTAVGPPIATIKPGERAADATISRIGTHELTRLHRVLRNTGRFHIVVFAGTPSITKDGLTSFRMESDAFTKLYPRHDEVLTYTTLIVGQGIGAAESLGQQPWGMTWFDHSAAAHTAYGIDVVAGAVVVLRPDGHVGTVIGLDDRGALSNYFGAFLH
ncbi:FAD binding domain-domain-containing protein [Naematelia encephala]|uniref:FAD binding domain-domain-containing protein n=1 Tax=Naematelia encephala TaxID=71784 RepID=A0A1Y2BKJ6_9TREE|nr:FAD binding domain-domain-containing protein [Naematelia encephala]